jgi:hypothetical protein
MPLPSTMTPIATNTLVSAGATVTFSSIPQGYTDLFLITNITGNASGDDLWLRFNGDTGTNYSSTYLSGNGTSAASGRRSNISRIMADVAYPTTTDGFNQLTHIMNYANSTTYKTVLLRANNTSQGTGGTVGLWRNTAAITQVDLQMGASGAQFKAGSTFTLYGIKAA